MNDLAVSNAALAAWMHILWERPGAARRLSRNEDHNDKNFTLTGSRHLGLEVGFPALAGCAWASTRAASPPTTRASCGRASCPGSPGWCGAW